MSAPMTLPQIIEMVEIDDAIDFLNRAADQLDRWAMESRTGGWSTHQVTANRRWADECRRQASIVSALRARLQSQKESDGE